LNCFSLRADAGAVSAAAPPGGGDRGGEGVLRRGEGGEGPLDGTLLIPPKRGRVEVALVLDVNM